VHGEAARSRANFGASARAEHAARVHTRALAFRRAPRVDRARRRGACAGASSLGALPNADPINEMEREVRAERELRRRGAVLGEYPPRERGLHDEHHGVGHRDDDAREVLAVLLVEDDVVDGVDDARLVPLRAVRVEAPRVIELLGRLAARLRRAEVDKALGTPVVASAELCSAQGGSENGQARSHTRAPRTPQRERAPLSPAALTWFNPSPLSNCGCPLKPPATS
jgi:hypothetical protein